MPGLAPGINVRAVPRVRTRGILAAVLLGPTLLLDRFEVGPLVATGGMGVIHRGEDRATGAPVAVKLLPSADAEAMRRFAREAALLSEVAHPAIVGAIAHGVTRDGCAFLVMEWLDGETLAARLARGPLDVAGAIGVARAVAGAVGALHARGLVHRDVKPSNVFLVDRRLDEVRLLDFGLARSIEHTYGLTSTGTMLGTAGFMPPEQIRGAAVGPPCDVFALGCLLYECLVGRAAFGADHAVAVLARVLFDDPPRLRDARPEVAAALDALVSQMIAKDPTARPADAAAVAAALGEPALTLVTSVSQRPPATLSERERRTTMIVVATPSPLEEAEPADTARRERSAQRAAAVARALAAIEPSAEVLGSGMAAVLVRASGTLSDQATRAARCALAVRARFPEAAVAIACGARETGAGVVGDVVDRAVAMLTAARRSGVRLDEPTASLLDDRFDVGRDDVGLMLEGERPLDADRPRLLLGRATPCVGRDRELRRVAGLLDEVAEERTPRAMVITAPAGAGKTRLRHEALRRARAAGWEVWLGRADAMRAGSAGDLIASLLRRVLQVGDEASPEVNARAVRERVTRRVPEGASVAELLAELAGAPVPDPSPELATARANPFALFEQQRRAFETLVRAECEAAPLVIVLEDLHWGDVPSIRIVEGAMRTLSRAPFAVLALARPEVHARFPGLFASVGAEELRLPPLGERACEALAREVLGDSASEEVIARLIERSTGHAFYLEELIRWHAEGGREGAPETVIGMVQSRLAALDTSARRALRAASVLGETFWAGGVTALAGATPEPVLGELVERELVVARERSTLASEREYAFRHAIVRDATYATIGEDDRAFAHAAAARWLEAAGARDPRTLAEHWTRAGDVPRAAAWYERATRGALRQHDPLGAIEDAARGLALGPEGAERVRLLLAHAEGDHWAGRFVSMLAHAREALSEVAAPDLLFYRAACSVLTGAVHRVEPVEEVLAAVRASFPVRVRDEYTMRVLALITPSLYQCGDREGGDHVYEQLSRRVPAEGLPDPSTRAAFAWMSAYRALYGTGDPWAAVRASEAARDEYARVSDHTRRAQVTVEAAYGRIYLGDASGARAALDALLAERRDYAMGLSEMLARLFRVRARLALDEAVYVVAEADALVGALAQTESRGLHSLALVEQARARAALGDLDGASEALAKSEVGGALVPVFDADGAALGAAIELARGRAEAARAYAEQGLARAREGHSIGCARFALHAAHARALEALGDRAGARATLAGVAHDARRIAAAIDVPAARAAFAASDAMRAIRLAAELER
ncbi:MAG: protein kinase [Sandaracinaceae bacterium]|nr:protein kinase [Sandaracinaceae bacterium]